MGRDTTGVTVLARNEGEAYKIGRKIFRKLVKKDWLWYFLTLDDYDKNAGIYTREFDCFKNCTRAMLVDRDAKSDGYKFVKRIIKYDQADDYNAKQLLELANALSTVTTKQQAQRFLVTGTLTFKNLSGKRETSHWLKSTMGSLSDTDKFVTGIYDQYWGKITSYYYLDWVLNRDPEDFKDSPKKAKIVADKNYKIYVIPALSKT